MKKDRNILSNLIFYRIIYLLSIASGKHERAKFVMFSPFTEIPYRIINSLEDGI